VSDEELHHDVVKEAF